MPHSTFRTTAFRVAFANAAAFSLVAMLSFGSLYLIASRNVLAQIDSDIEADRRALLDDDEDGGLVALTAAIATRVEVAGDAETGYLLRDRNGHLLGGNLPDVVIPAGWAWITMPRQEAGPQGGLLRVHGEVLIDGAALLVGRDPQRLDELRKMFVGTLVWAGLGTVLPGLLIGTLAGRRALRGVQMIAEAADRIGAGELTRRIPDIAGGGEIVRIGSVVNLMLDRIGTLSTSLRQVTDDIAHDLRTPLSRLRQHLERSSRHADSADQLREAIGLALQEADSIIATFNALLRIAQIEGGDPCRGFAATDLSGLLHRLVDIYAPSAEDSGHLLASHIRPGQLVFGDVDLLGQMVANLIENALSHTPRGSRIDIVLGVGPAAARLVIRDDGPGIPRTERARVFGRLVRLDASRNTPGTGLGLALVKAVADIHGIAVALQDGEPGLRIVLDFPPVVRAPTWPSIAPVRSAASAAQPPAAESPTAIA